MARALLTRMKPFNLKIQAVAAWSLKVTATSYGGVKSQAHRRASHESESGAPGIMTPGQSRGCRQAASGPFKPELEMVSSYER